MAGVGNDTGDKQHGDDGDGSAGLLFYALGQQRVGVFQQQQCVSLAAPGQCNRVQDHWSGTFMNNFIEGLKVWEEPPGVVKSMGFPMNQNRLAVPVWSYAMELYRPDRIIELGSYNGGFTLALAFAGWTEKVAVHSIDRMEAPTQEWKRLGEFLGINFKQGDIWQNQSYIIELIEMEGVSFLLCDGGDKAKEFETFAQWLKPGDIIAVHDYQTPWWPWSEVTHGQLAKTVREQNLAIWNPELFDLAGWIAFRKETA